jgi:hypothetical protein
MWVGVGEANDLMGLLPKYAVMVSHRPPKLTKYAEEEEFRCGPT